MWIALAGTCKRKLGCCKEKIPIGLAGTMTNRCMGALAAATVLLLPLSGAQAQTFDGHVRAIVLFATIPVTCGKYMPVSQNASYAMFDEAMNKGIARYGKARIQAAIPKETQRRSLEIAVTGPEQWCRYQRSSFREMGNRSLFLD